MSEHTRSNTSSSRPHADATQPATAHRGRPRRYSAHGGATNDSQAIRLGSPDFSQLSAEHRQQAIDVLGELLAGTEEDA